MPLYSGFYPQLTSKMQTGIASAQRKYKWSFVMVKIYSVEYSEELQISNNSWNFWNKGMHGTGYLGWTIDIFYYPNVKFFNIVHRKLSATTTKNPK